MCNEYNGYTNRDTWAVALWIDHNRGSQEYFHQLALACELDVHILAASVKDYHEEFNPLLDAGASIYSDLMTSALGSVDWYDVARSLVISAAEGLSYDGADFDRFDIAEAYYLFLTEHHDGSGEGRFSYGRLSRMSKYFKPAPGLCFETLEENGQAIYAGLVSDFLQNGG